MMPLNLSSIRHFLILYATIAKTLPNDPRPLADERAIKALAAVTLMPSYHSRLVWHGVLKARVDIRPLTLNRTTAPFPWPKRPQNLSPPSRRPSFIAKAGVTGKAIPAGTQSRPTYTKRPISKGHTSMPPPKVLRNLS